jgi:purine nucleoside permease
LLQNNLAIHHKGIQVMISVSLRRSIMSVVALAAFAMCTAKADARDFTDSSNSGDRIPVRFVVVTTFDTSDDLKDPGEFATWVVNFPLSEVIPFPQGYHDLRYNSSKQVLGIETGEGPTHMAASITALANDRRFDFTHAYWILAGIAGIDPNAGPVGSAAWASYVIDGDLAYEIDAREIPPGWSTGYVPLGRTTPYQLPVPPAISINGENLFRLKHRSSTGRISSVTPTRPCPTPPIYRRSVCCTRLFLRPSIHHGC